jgi:Cu/Ag efflux protein CusF
MDAMTMRFPVPDETEWNKLAVGEEILATVFVNDEGFHIGEIQIVEAPETEESAQPQGPQP